MQISPWTFFHKDCAVPHKRMEIFHPGFSSMFQSNATASGILCAADFLIAFLRPLLVKRQPKHLAESGIERALYQGR